MVVAINMSLLAELDPTALLKRRVAGFGGGRRFPDGLSAAGRWVNPLQERIKSVGNRRTTNDSRMRPCSSNRGVDLCRRAAKLALPVDKTRLHAVCFMVLGSAKPISIGFSNTLLRISA